MDKYTVFYPFLMVYNGKLSKLHFNVSLFSNGRAKVLKSNKYGTYLVQISRTFSPRTVSLKEAFGQKNVPHNENTAESTLNCSR